MADGFFGFLARKLAMNCLLLFLVSLSGFVLLHHTPGGPLAQFALAPGMTAARLSQIAHGMGLDRPLSVQYVEWLAHLLRGNWGVSYRDKSPVLSVILAHFPATAELGIASLVMSFGLGACMGLAGALKAGSAMDISFSALATVLFSLPTFWLGLILIYVFSVHFGWLPSGNMLSPGNGSPGDYLRHLVLPAATLGLVSVPVWSSYVRSFAGEVLRQDHIRTARALGLSEARIVGRHVLRAALLPLIPVAGVQLPTLFSGALVTETVFTWPGIGRLFLDSLEYRDYPVVMGILMFSAVIVLTCSLGAEIIHHVADPRLRG